jgi:hypothetical protein
MAAAVAQFQKGLDQLALLPDIPERQRRELELRSALGAVLLALRGCAAQETGQAYACARVLWGQLDFPRCAMSTKSREVIWGGQIMGAEIHARHAREEARKAAREADRAEARGGMVAADGRLWRARAAVANDRAMYPRRPGLARGRMQALRDPRQPSA